MRSMRPPDRRSGTSSRECRSHRRPRSPTAPCSSCHPRDRWPRSMLQPDSRNGCSPIEYERKFEAKEPARLRDRDADHARRVGRLHVVARGRERRASISAVATATSTPSMPHRRVAVEICDRRRRARLAGGRWQHGCTSAAGTAGSTRSTPKAAASNGGCSQGGEEAPTFTTRSASSRRPRSSTARSMSVAAMRTSTHSMRQRGASAGTIRPANRGSTARRPCATARSMSGRPTVRGSWRSTQGAAGSSGTSTRRLTCSRPPRSPATSPISAATMAASTPSTCASGSPPGRTRPKARNATRSSSSTRTAA